MEITIKSTLEKIELLEPWEQTLSEIERLTPDLILPMTVRHLQVLHGLPRPHSDPFDRMLVAQAQADDFTVVSSDRSFEHYGVPRIW